MTSEIAQVLSRDFSMNLEADEVGRMSLKELEASSAKEQKEDVDCQSPRPIRRIRSKSFSTEGLHIPSLEYLQSMQTTKWTNAVFTENLFE